MLAGKGSSIPSSVKERLKQVQCICGSYDAFAAPLEWRHVNLGRPRSRRENEENELTLVLSQRRGQFQAGFIHRPYPYVPPDGPLLPWRRTAQWSPGVPKVLVFLVFVFVSCLYFGVCFLLCFLDHVMFGRVGRWQLSSDKRTQASDGYQFHCPCLRSSEEWRQRSDMGWQRFFLAALVSVSIFFWLISCLCSQLMVETVLKWLENEGRWTFAGLNMPCRSAKRWKCDHLGRQRL